MTTIKDVAKLAGVSIATVSATINGTATVSERLSRRVREAIDVTGYSPHGIARSLRLGRSRSIGLVIGDISNPLHTAIARAVEARAQEAGYLVIVASSHDDEHRELQLLQLLREQQVAGILLTPTGHGDRYLAALAQMAGLPIIQIDRLLPNSPFDAVLIDNVAAARMVTEYLIRLNHRRIAMVYGQPAHSTTQARLQGYRETLRSAGISPDAALELAADLRVEAAYEVVQRLMSQPEPPSAIFAANNLMLLGAFQAVLDMGFRCPEQISIAGVDDFSWSTAVRPRLTTVSQPLEDLGTQAVDLLLGRIQQKIDRADPRAARTITLGPRLMIRDSCAPFNPPGTDRPVSVHS
jgi:LacI family transcriptional regulator